MSLVRLSPCRRTQPAAVDFGGGIDETDGAERGAGRRRACRGLDEMLESMANEATREDGRTAAKSGPHCSVPAHDLP